MAKPPQHGSGPFAPQGLPGHLAGFVESLRAKGLPVGPAETVDAGRVLTHVDLLDRNVLKEGLACALVRRATHRPIFDGIFDLWFPEALGSRSTRDSALEVPRTPEGDIDIPALREMLADLLTADTPEARDELENVVSIIVDELGAYRSVGGESYSAYQSLQAISPEALTKKLLDGLLSTPGGPDEEGGTAPQPFREEVAKRNAAELVSRLRSAVENETRRRVAQRQGRERVASYAVPKVAEQVDFLRASDDDLVALRKSVAPLARLLATRLAARRKRYRAGAIDIRRTMRKSMTTGGVPIDLVLHTPRPARPELVVLCDMSGSVAGFSNFTLQLVHTLREQFSRVRVFAFIDTTDEVTEFFNAGSELGVSVSRMIREARLITYDGHSDYGHAFGTFVDNFSEALTGRSSLLVLGDGRTNYRDPNLAALAQMVTLAKHAHWLNPEPARQWPTGDSAAEAYRQLIPMHECRTAEHLAAVVARLLPV